MIPDQRLGGKCTKQKKCFLLKQKMKQKKNENCLAFYMTEEIFFS
jgi:hypothetical protein